MIPPLPRFSPNTSPLSLSLGPGVGNSGGNARKSGGQKNSTLRPVTVKQLRDCCSSVDAGDDNFTVSGHALDNVVVMGKVVQYTEQSTNIKIILDDGTGKVETMFWLESDAADEGGQVEDPHGPNSRAEWREGKYIKIFGHLRAMQGKRHIVAFTIKPVTDMNELTFHMLDTIFTHLQLTGAGQGAVQMTPGQKRVMGPAVGGMGSAAPMGGAAAPQEFAGMPGMSPCQKAAFEAFHEPQAMNNDAGLSFDQLKVKLGNRFTPSDLKQAVEDLQNDGHIYTTVDDMHFKGTGA